MGGCGPFRGLGETVPGLTSCLVLVCRTKGRRPRFQSRSEVRTNGEATRRGGGTRTGWEMEFYSDWNRVGSTILPHKMTRDPRHVSPSTPDRRNKMNILLSLSNPIKRVQMCRLFTVPTLNLGVWIGDLFARDSCGPVSVFPRRASTTPVSFLSLGPEGWGHKHATPISSVKLPPPGTKCVETTLG